MASSVLENLEKLVGTPRDGALLRYSLGLEYLKLGEARAAIAHLREAVARDPHYSAAWKALGKALERENFPADALEAFRHGIEAARRNGDKQAEKEMTVFARRIEKAR
jgi:Tfp pilus assembly protein PilF